MSPKLGDGTNQPAGRTDRGTVGVGVIFRGIRRYPLVAVAALLLAGGAAAGVWFFLPLPKMTAYTVFQISSSPNAVLAPVGDAKADFRVYAKSQESIIKSRRVVNAAMTPELAQLPILQGHDDPLAWLEYQLEVDFKLGPEFMRLSLEGDEPEQMKAIVSAVSRTYMERVVEADRSRKQAQLDSLDAVHRRYTDMLRERQASIQRHAELLGSTDPKSLAEKERTLQEQVRAIQKELFEIRSKIWQTEIQLRGRQNQANSDGPVPDDVIVQTVRSLPSYKALDDRRAALEMDIEDLKKRLVNTRHPSLAARESELAQVKKDLAAEETNRRAEVVARIKENAAREGRLQTAELQQTLTSLKDFEERFGRELADVTKKIRDLNLNQLELEQLKRDIELFEQLQKQLAQNMEAIRLELDTPPRVAQWEEATVVPGIEGKRRLKYTLMAGVGVLALGLGLTTLLEMRNRRVRDTTELSGELGLKVLGMVPSLPPASGNSVPGEWQYLLTESVDATRTILLHGLNSPKPSRTFLITSPMPGEGKTSLSGHLAISLARVGYRTLLVDADMRRPGIHRLMGLEVSPGLSEVLRGDCQGLDAIRATAIDRLSVLPAGRWDRAASTALVGEGWPALRRQLEADFEFVILDTSPLLAVTDTLLLAPQTDGVILSTLWNTSEFAALGEATQRLQAVGGVVLGVVLSGVRGQTYLSRYGRYGRETKTAPQHTG